MKKLNIIKCTLAFVILALSSCMDLTLQSTKPTLNDSSESLMRGLLTSGYNIMMSGTMYGEASWSSVGGCDTDESYYKYLTTLDNTTIGGHGITPVSSSVKAYYQQFYQGIESCNMMLEMAKQVTLDSITKNDLIGQARTLRAFYYYQLAVSFGPVPLKTVPTHLMTNFELKRDSVKKVCQFALNEMRSSIPLLKPISQVGFTGQITKSAAEALSFRVAIYMASHPDIQDVAKYDSIAVWGKKFIDSGLHALNSTPYTPLTANNSTWNETVSAYARLFVRNMENKSAWGGEDKEGIFDAIFYAKSTTTGTYANLGYLVNQKLGSLIGVECGITSVNQNPIGFCKAFYLPQPTLLTKYESGDLRALWNINTYCYKDSIASNKRYPFYFFDFAAASVASNGKKPTTGMVSLTPTRKAVLVPSFLNSTINTDPASIMIYDGGAGYKDSTYWVPLDGYPLGLKNTPGTITGIKHQTTDVTRATTLFYPDRTTRVQVQVQGGSITAILAIASQGGLFPLSGFTAVTDRGIGKWRREYEINLTPERNMNFTSCNFPVIRYADVLLMVAEASLFNSGSKGGATVADGKEYLNMVRRRGYGLDPKTPSVKVDRELTLDMIQDERSRELCFEGVRRTDLVRWGEVTYRKVATKVNADIDLYSGGLTIAKTAINLLISNYKKYQILPIPSSEISAAPNTFYQNAGW